MGDGYDTLTEREKQTLRLIVRGHDAKSAARTLGLSVHTINERLRDARRKLGVSSSREAARLVLAREGGASGAVPPKSLVDKDLGEAPTPAPMAPAFPRPRPAAAIVIVIVIGAAVMFTILGLAALVALPQAGVPAATEPPTGTTAVEAEAPKAALRWLALVDEGRWADSWAATGAQFRAAVTVQEWTNASQGVRAPLGAVRSRDFGTQESVPAPPNGVEVVRFRTSFAAKPNAIETVSLAREDGAWRVVGYFIR